VSSADAGGTRVRLSNLERILWPEVGWTKGAMVDYYAAVAGVLLPHLKGRPLTLGRWPTGVGGKGWYQTNCRGAPSWLRTAAIPASRGDAVFRMCVVDDVDSLLWVVNQGTLELHPYLSAADRFDEPLVLVFDLDPGPPAGLSDCCRVAVLLRDRLGVAGARAAVKTSGAAGLHVYLATATGTSFDDTRGTARELAAALASEQPAAIVDGFTHTERAGRVLIDCRTRSRDAQSIAQEHGDAAAIGQAGRVLIDWRQNERARSQVAPYSLRALPWPLVSTPVDWAEVEIAASSGDVRPLYFAPEQVIERIGAHGDLFGRALERPTIEA
jgi:bifunctional non-homologous end joining protein LigD